MARSRRVSHVVAVMRVRVALHRTALQARNNSQIKIACSSRIINVRFLCKLCQRGQQKQPALQTAVDAIPGIQKKKGLGSEGGADEATRARGASKYAV